MSPYQFPSTIEDLFANIFPSELCRHTLKMFSKPKSFEMLTPNNTQCNGNKYSFFFCIFQLVTHPAIMLLCSRGIKRDYLNVGVNLSSTPSSISQCQSILDDLSPPCHLVATDATCFHHQITCVCCAQLKYYF